MGTFEAGKERVEQFITEMALSMSRESSVGSFLWWSTGSLDPNGGGAPGETTVTLRIYKGNSWRSIGFVRSDIDSCADSPEVLKKYEGEIAQILADI